MALLDEQLVEEWLNRKRFFTIRGIKCGLGEIDLLAIRPGPDSFECWHVEVQISFRPMSYIGGGPNARRRTPDDVRAGIAEWVEKKFTGAAKSSKRSSVLPGVSWKFVLVHAEVRHKEELELLRDFGVELVSYRQILDELLQEADTHSSSVASNIADILRFTR